MRKESSSRKKVLFKQATPSWKISTRLRCAGCVCECVHVCVVCVSVCCACECVLCVRVCVVCASSIYGVDFLIVRDRREKIAQDTASLNWLMQLMSRCKEAAEAAPFSSPSPPSTADAAAFVPGFQRALIDATYVYMLRIRRQLQAESSRYLASTTEDDRQLYYIHIWYTYIYIYMIYICCCWGNCSAIL